MVEGCVATNVVFEDPDCSIEDRESWWRQVLDAPGRLLADVTRVDPWRCHIAREVDGSSRLSGPSRLQTGHWFRCSVLPAVAQLV